MCTAVDVLPPQLVCPSDLEVTAANWGDNSTIVHYDVQKPQISDNSGQFDYRVVGVPNEQLRFPVGFVALTYEAFDAAGNTASCVQYIHVRGRLYHCKHEIVIPVSTYQQGLAGVFRMFKHPPRNKV